MQSNSELANSWNIKQNSDENNLETDTDDNLNESNSEEPINSNKSLTKYYLFSDNLYCVKLLVILYNLFIYFLDYYYLI